MCLDLILLCLFNFSLQVFEAIINILDPQFNVLDLREEDMDIRERLEEDTDETPWGSQQFTFPLPEEEKYELKLILWQVTHQTLITHSLFLSFKCMSRHQRP